MGKNKAFMIVALLIAAMPGAMAAGEVEFASGAALRAGTAKAVITPDIALRPVGVMGNRLEAVHDDLYARALTLFDGARRMAIVTYDLNCLDVATPILRERCRDELGIDPACLVLLATHNHAAPIQIVPENFAYGGWLAARIFDLIREAMDNESGPARLEFGGGHAYFLKNMGRAPIDYEVQLLRVLRGDAALAMLFNHPAHPLDDFSGNAIGAGHPGVAVAEIERRMPGCMAMYADACGGNQFTMHGMNAPRAVVEAIGRELADEVMAIAARPMRDVSGPISARLEVISLPLAKPMPYEEAKRLANFYPKDIGLVPYPHKDRENNWVRALIRNYEEGIPFPTRTTDWVCTDDGFLVQEYDALREFPCRYEECIAAAIGPLIFVAMQGEVCAPIGMRVKDAWRQERPIMVFAYMGEHNLYIPTRELVRQGVYQATVIQTQYASPVGWHPSVEDEMVDGVNRLIARTLRKE